MNQTPPMTHMTPAEYRSHGSSVGHIAMRKPVTMTQAATSWLSLMNLLVFSIGCVYGCLSGDSPVAMGLPQCGHVGAIVETGRVQSGHFVSAIA